MPLMNLDCRRRGAPVACMSGTRREQLAEHHGDLAAGEVGAEAEVRPGAAEADVGVGRAAHVERVRVGEVRRVAVGGAVEQHHLVARPHRLAAEHGVDRERAAHEDHRRGPADDLLDGRRRDAVEVGEPDLPLLGVLGEQVQALADGVAGGLVARHDEQDEEARQLVGGEPLAVDLGVDQRGREVVGRAVAPAARPSSRISSASSWPACSSAVDDVRPCPARTRGRSRRG